jgi:hypothetical protein
VEGQTLGGLSADARQPCEVLHQSLQGGGEILHSISFFVRQALPGGDRLRSCRGPIAATYKERKHPSVSTMEANLLMWQLNIATLIRFFTAVLLAPCGATAKHGNYYSGKFMFFKLEKKYLLAGEINPILCARRQGEIAALGWQKRPAFSVLRPHGPFLSIIR